MKIKTIVELLTLSTTLYTISRDEKLMNELQGLATKGKDGLDRLVHEFSKNEYDEYEDEDRQIISKLMEKASEIKSEFDLKIEEYVQKIYEKMHIAHTNDLNILKDEISKLKDDLAQKNDRISLLEQKTSN